MTKQEVMCDKHVAPFTVSTSSLNGLGVWSVGNFLWRKRCWGVIRPRWSSGMFFIRILTSEGGLFKKSKFTLCSVYFEFQLLLKIKQFYSSIRSTLHFIICTSYYDIRQVAFSYEGKPQGLVTTEEFLNNPFRSDKSSREQKIKDHKYITQTTSPFRYFPLMDLLFPSSSFYPTRTKH